MLHIRLVKFAVLLSIAFLASVSAKASFDLTRHYLVSCRTNSCDKALEFAVNNGCFGSKSCKKLIDQYYPECSLCAEELMDPDNLESIGDQEFLFCNKEDSLHILTCSYFCRVKLQPFSECKRVEGYPVCACSDTNPNTTTSTTSSTTTTAPTTLIPTTPTIPSISLNATVLSGHEGSVYSIAQLNDGYLASASEDKTVKIWNLADGSVRLTLSGHYGPVYTVLATLRGDLVSGSADNKIIVWDPVDGEIKGTLTGHFGAVSCLVNLSGSRIASGSTDQTIRIWNLEDNRLERTLTGHFGAVNSLALLDNGYLASGSSDGTVKIWNIDEGRLLQTLDGHDSPVLSLLVLPNGKLLSCSFQGIMSWDTSDLSPNGTLERYNYIAASSLALLSNGEFVFGNDDHTITLASLSSQDILYHGHTGDVYSLLELKNKALASSSADGTIRLWNPYKGYPGNSIYPDVIGYINSMALLNNGDIVYAHGDLNEPNEIRVIDQDNTLKLSLIGHSNYVNSMIQLENGDLVSASNVDGIKIWNLNDGSIKKTLTEHTNSSGYITLVSFTDGGFASVSRDRVIKWDQHGTVLNQLDNITAGFCSVAALPNGDLAIGTDEGEVKIWNLRDGTLMQELKGQPGSVTALAVLKNGKLAVQSYGNIGVWDLATGEFKFILEEYYGYSKILGLPSGDLANMIHNGRTRIEIRDSENGVIKRTLMSRAYTTLSIGVSQNNLIVGDMRAAIGFEIWKL